MNANKTKPFSGKRYSKNSGTNSNPCAVCGAFCAADSSYVVVAGGGSRFATETEVKGAAEIEGDMGCFPVGPDCAAKIQAQGAYVFSK